MSTKGFLMKTVEPDKTVERQQSQRRGGTMRARTVVLVMLIFFLVPRAYCATYF